MYKKISFLIVLIALLTLLSACNDTHDDDDHLDIVGLEILLDGQPVVIQARNPQSGQIEVDGTIDVVAGETSPMMTVVFKDPDGDNIVITDSDFSIEINPTSTLEYNVYHDPSQARWGFMVEGKQEGDGIIQISLLHGIHADFESRPITVQVHSSDD
ncbi:MAG: hypothetical protein ACNA8K_08840 [Cyclonatronaceae bacterium]